MTSLLRAVTRLAHRATSLVHSSNSAFATGVIPDARPETLDAYYLGRFPRHTVEVNARDVGWVGHIAYRDSAPHLAGRDDTVTLVVSAGYLCAQDLYAELYLQLFDRLSHARRFRLIAYDMPAHGASDAPPVGVPPRGFNYRMPEMGEVSARFLDTLGLGAHTTLLTSSLGYLASMYECIAPDAVEPLFARPFGTDDIHSGQWRFHRVVAVGISPLQLSIRAGGWLGQRREKLGGKNLLDLLVDTAGPQVLERTDGLRAGFVYEGYGMPRAVQQALLARLDDPAVAAALFAMTYGFWQYRRMGELLLDARPPAAQAPVELTLLARRQDLITRTTDMRREAQRLRANPGGFDVRYALLAGGHYTVEPSELAALAKWIVPGIVQDLEA